LLAKAAGRTKDEIEELVAALAPRPPPPTVIRKLPEPQALPLVDSAPQTAPPPPPRPVVPVAQDTFKVQFAISREFRDEIREAQDVLRHRIPDGDLATLFRMALRLLVADVKKERFGIGCKPRSMAEPKETSSRHVPDAIKRTVYERDGGRCTFADHRGHRCTERGFLEFDHVEGFARTHLHDVEAIRLLCRAHNQFSADGMYGSAFMNLRRGQGGTRSRFQGGDRDH
jgi:hypothetical protein